uniref:FK506-binding protein n=2 Tax=Spongospora subterranea TaxID=70186 RepID=A0A0H5R417_9EUKA|eukprot:CRZ08945.1 hypothetical protein [Spongospora subterranea]
MTMDCDVPSASGFEFWGATIVPGKTVKCQITGNILHLTSIAMDETIRNEPNQRSVLSVIIDDKQFVLGSLRESIAEQVSVDFLFRENKVIKFKATGNTTLHLVGYLQPLDLMGEDEEITSDEDEMSEEEIESEEEDDDDEVEQAVPVSNNAGGKKRQADSSTSIACDQNKKVKPQPKSAPESSPAPAADAPIKPSSDAKNKAPVDAPKQAAPVEKETKKPNNAKNEPKKKVENVEEPVKVDNSKKAETEPTPVKSQKKDAVASPKPAKQGAENEFEKLFGGVMIKDTHLGEGKVAVKGKRLGVMYKGMLQNGKVFDSNMNSNKPFHFKLGNGDVIKAWDIAFSGMKVGGKRTIVCPPKMAYGKEGSPPVIPPNSILVFEVELVNVK